MSTTKRLTLSLTLAAGLLAALSTTAHGAAALEGLPPVSTVLQGQEILMALVGEWRGTCKTWFKPGELADESIVEGTIEALPGGALVRHRYEGSMLGRPRQGEELISYNRAKPAFQVAWVDDFHMNYGILHSEGGPTDGGFAVTGEYDLAPGQPVWGWRTEYKLVDADHLTITAYNIMPSGDEAKGVETVYERRVSAGTSGEPGDPARASAEHDESDGADGTSTGLTIGLNSVPVADQAEALSFYTESLGFVKKTDIPLGGGYRWLTVGSADESQTVELLLEPNSHPAVQVFQKAMHADGIPMTIFYVDDVEAEYERLQALGVEFTMPPTAMGSSTSAILDDTCGNCIQITQIH